MIPTISFLQPSSKNDKFVVRTGIYAYTETVKRLRATCNRHALRIAHTIRKKVNVPSYIAQYSVLRTAQSD